MARRFLPVCFALVSSALLAWPALGVRTEFIARFEGKRLPESQVCFFPAARDDGFFEKFLSSADVRCLSADAVIEMPVGNWNAFAETGDSYTSTHPTFQFGNEESEAARRGYRPVTMDMRRAARIRFDVEGLARGVRPVVYFPNLGTEEPASVRPLVSGRDFILVPASTPVVPLLVRGPEIVAVGEVAILEPGATADARFRQLGNGRRDLVALLRIPGEIDDEDPAADPLDVHVESGTTLLQPVVPTRKGLGNERSLAIFHDVPAGGATLVIAGTGWSSHRLSIAPSNDSVQVLRDGIAIGRRAELDIGWSLPEAELVRPCRKEHDTPSAPKDRAMVAIERCDEKRCEVVAEAPIEGADARGRVHRSDLAWGHFRVSLRHSRFGSVSRDIELRRGRVSDVALALQAVSVRGSVKEGDREMAADISFATGNATADSNGQYAALLSGPPARQTVSVFPCNGSEEYIAVPKEPLHDGSVYDIAIPDTELTVEVSDAQSGAPIEGASVTAAVLEQKDGDEWFFLDPPPTAESGATTLRRVTPEIWLRICAHQRDYEARCADAFTLAPDEHKSIALALKKRQVLEGRILADAPIAGGRLFWITPTGSVTEMRTVSEDGTFYFSKPHAPPEHVVFMALNQPLRALHLASTRNDELLEIALPPAPVRDVVLIPRSLDNARIALEIDGLLVPENVFGQHQSLRREQSAIHDGQRLSVRGIGGQNVVVLVGPRTDAVPAGAAPDADLASMPQFRALFRAVQVIGPTVELP